MKTPDEIKKGLELCPKDECETCTYEASWSCVDDLKTDALAYFRQVESTYSQVSKALCGKENATLDEVLQAVSQVKTELEAVKRERDAAASELVGTCQVCRWEETAKCASCHFNVDAWNVCESNWEFRGVCPENTEVQEDG